MRHVADVVALADPSGQGTFVLATGIRLRVPASQRPLAELKAQVRHTFEAFLRRALADAAARLALEHAHRQVVRFGDAQCFVDAVIRDDMLDAFDRGWLTVVHVPPGLPAGAPDLDLRLTGPAWTAGAARPASAPPKPFAEWDRLDRMEEFVEQGFGHAVLQMRGEKAQEMAIILLGGVAVAGVAIVLMKLLAICFVGVFASGVGIAVIVALIVLNAGLAWGKALMLAADLVESVALAITAKDQAEFDAATRLFGTFVAEFLALFLMPFLGGLVRVLGPFVRSPQFRTLVRKAMQDERALKGSGQRANRELLKDLAEGFDKRALARDRGGKLTQDARLISDGVELVDKAKDGYDVGRKVMGLEQEKAAKPPLPPAHPRAGGRPAPPRKKP